jgi:hypothetical protein
MKPMRTSPCIALILGIALAAGCSHQGANTAPQGQTLQTAGAPLQPYTVVAQLPPKPAVVQDQRRALHLTYRNDHYYLADKDGDYYDAARDARGKLYPAYYDRELGKYCPLYYDGDRDRYYCAVRQDGRFYRRYWDDPQDMYYDNQYDYDDYQPPTQDRPVVYVQNNYYNEFNKGSFNQPHHSHNNNALWAIPVVAAAFIVLSHTGHHANPAYVAHNIPPRPAAIYRSGAPSARPIIVSQKRTVIVRQAPAQRPSPPNGHGPIRIVRAPNLPPAEPLTRRNVAAGTAMGRRNIAARPPAPPFQPGPRTQQRPFFAHKQSAPRIAAKPAPKPMPVAVKPARRSIPVAARPVAKPILRAAKPTHQLPPAQPLQVAKRPFGVHTHPMILAKPAPKPAPKMEVRAPAPPKQPARAEKRVAHNPPVTEHKPQAAAPAKVAMPAPAHPAPKVAARQVVKAKPTSPPAYHRTPPPAQTKPVSKPASAPVNKWRARVNNMKPPAKEGGSGNGDQKKKQASG